MSVLIAVLVIWSILGATVAFASMINNVHEKFSLVGILFLGPFVWLFSLIFVLSKLVSKYFMKP